MATPAQLKTARTSAKRAATKQANQIRQCIAEDDLSHIADHVAKLKDLFGTFTTAHNNYHALLTDEDEVDASDAYFYKEQNEYIVVLGSTKGLTHNVKVETDHGGLVPSKSSHSDISQEQFLSLLNLPKVELQTFDGNPRHFHQFMRAFDVNVDKLCDDDNLKLVRLMQYTTGSAKEAIRGCQLIEGSAGYSQARSILESRFGNKFLVTEHLIKGLKSGKQLRSPYEIQQLADDMKSTLITLGQLNTLDEVKSQSFILDVVTRLPNYVQLRWKKFALKSRKNNESYPGFAELVEFVDRIAKEVNDPVYGNMHPKRSGTNQGVSLNSSVSPQSSNPGFSPKTDTSRNFRSYAKPELPCILCSQPHRLWHCDKFKQMSPRDRLQMVVDHKLCHNCLLASHTTDNCGKRSVCGVKGCGRKHTMYIHCPETSPPETKVSNVSFHSDRKTYMPIVQIIVNNSCRVFALLDSGSSNSFCSEGLVHKLSLQGRSLDFQLSTLNESNIRSFTVVDLAITSDTGETMQMNDVCVVGSIPVKNTLLDISMYAHFDDVGSLPAYSRDDLVVDLLIGQDNAEALVPLEVRRGSPGQPFAVRTLFGWCVNGRSPVNKVCRRVISNFVSCLPADDVSRLWRIENEGLECSSWSHEDKSVIKLWDQEHRRVDGHYELPIPWRDRTEPLPNNFIVAKSRLDSLNKRLVDSGLHSRYSAEIDKLLVKGYAEEVPPDEMTGERIWYLPHHGVVTDKKPDKLRVVFDCACKYKGKSLNERCLQGPDLVNKLLPVVLRFRQHSIAIQADIEAMYNQVRIPLKDRDALRFLWYIDGQLTYYRMTSHLFGGVWCAASSTYALRRTITDTPETHPLVKFTLESSFYVDDCLSSVSSKSDAKTIIKETPKVLRNGGFSLKKFVVNDKELLSEVAEDCVSEEVRTLGAECESCALGIKWKVSTDQFFFEVRQDKVGPITRRKMLSVVSSIFDPLGLLGPLILTGKLLFQEATANKLSWDEVVPVKLENAWYSWLESCDRTKQLKIPRCVKPVDFDDASIELHHFCDASLRAYGCCSYIRCINKYGRVHVQLIISKGKVSPLKLCTIPRLELQAAVMAAKVDTLLRRELDLEVTNSCFWTDSEIVLKYINNDSRRFHIFVGNRVSLIRQLTDPSQWHYVAGKSNPADLVTRPQSNLKSDDEWFFGPGFLYKYKHDWNIGDQKPIDLTEDDPEVRKLPIEHVASNIVANDHVCLDFESSVSLANTATDDPLGLMMQHYSSWYRMKRALAWWLKFLEYLKGRKPVNRLTVGDIHHAGEVLIRKAQLQSFASEVSRLQNGRFVKASSNLKMLNPYLDDHGLLRMKGRVDEDKMKNPLIISGKHVIAASIVNDVHSVTHVGVEWVLSMVRKEFWITKARPLIKKIIHACVTCKRLYSKAGHQLMADLPKERTEAGKLPFSTVGVDVFGPFYVKYGRSEIKRYGCLFTCFCTRAIHIEKLDTLDTESFLNSLRRFIARRGHPELMYSDNGTNFVGGAAELKTSLNELSQKVVDAYAVKQNIVWHFNPPKASHMGGIWERLIGVVKRVMMAVLPRQVRLTDEILATVFCEVEAIVNGRPLTKVNDDPNDPSFISPNHILLLRNSSSHPPGIFNQQNIRSRWRHVQHLANQFWRKWLKFYLPELQRRSKWVNPVPNLAVGDLVLVSDEATPRNLWPLALVKQIIHGRDGLVRSVVKLKTRATELLRPITKLILLEGSVPI